MRFYLAAQISNLRKRFYDNFASRSNTSGNLGTATDGSRWTPINGIIQVISGKAKASSIPSSNANGSSYPMATIDMPTTNNIIEITSMEQGAAAALWVQSSTDWWLIDIDSTFNTIPGNSNYGVTGSNYGKTGDNYGATGTNYGATGSNYGKVGDNYGVVGSNSSTGTTTNETTTYSSAGYTITFTGYGFGYAPAYSSSTTYTTITNYYAGNSNYGDTGDNYGAVGSNYGATGTNYGDTGDNYGVVGTNYGVSGTNATTYAYAQYLRIKQSSAGVVSTITSALISASQTINSLRVQLVGNQITAKSYSDANLVSQIGSDLVYTATGATITTRFGIALSNSSYQQSDVIGSSVNISRS